ncbi:MAG: helix-turn-helix transcriptional regulator [Planctomycetes bacterium]|nr:helix-turn-helix transcriptional regulator [Planctomycetota bacterium]
MVQPRPSADLRGVASDPVARAFGAALKQLREQRKLTQEELAHRASTSQSYLSLLEKGRRTPSLATIVLLARGLRLSATELVRAYEQQ